MIWSIPELPELSQLWVWTGALMTAVGPTMAIWGAVATHRARKSEARWKGPEITLTPSRTEDGWTQMILHIRNRQDIEMTLEQVRVLRPRRAALIAMAEWEARAEKDPAGAESSKAFTHPVKAGPAEGRRPSAKLTVFIKAAGWNPMQTPARVDVLLREDSMTRRCTRFRVVSHLLKPAQEPLTTPVMHRPRASWMAYGGQRRDWPE